MTAARGALLLAHLVALAGVSACTDEGPVSGPGFWTATLVSPNGDEGAAVVVLTGEGVGAIEPLGGTEIHRDDADGTTRLVLIDVDGGLLAFRLQLADTTARPAVFIQEVAGPDDQLRAGLHAYRLEIGP